MPIDTDSEEWSAGSRPDPLEVHVSELLRTNPDQAFHLAEITDWILEERSESLFLLDDVDGEIDDETYGLVECRVAAKLEDLDWRRFVESRLVETDGTRRTYFSNSEKDPISPIAAVHDVFPLRFDDIENDLEELSDWTRDLSGEIDDLQQRLDRIEGE